MSSSFAFVTYLSSACVGVGLLFYNLDDYIKWVRIFMKVGLDEKIEFDLIVFFATSCCRLVRDVWNGVDDLILHDALNLLVFHCSVLKVVDLAFLLPSSHTIKPAREFFFSFLFSFQIGLVCITFCLHLKLAINLSFIEKKDRMAQMMFVFTWVSYFLTDLLF